MAWILTIFISIVTILHLAHWTWAIDSIDRTGEYNYFSKITFRFGVLESHDDLREILDILLDFIDTGCFFNPISYEPIALSTPLTYALYTLLPLEPSSSPFALDANDIQDAVDHQHALPNPVPFLSQSLLQGTISPESVLANQYLVTSCSKTLLYNALQQTNGIFRASHPQSQTHLSSLTAELDIFDHGCVEALSLDDDALAVQQEEHDGSVSVPLITANELLTPFHYSQGAYCPKMGEMSLCQTDLDCPVTSSCRLYRHYMTGQSEHRCSVIHHIISSAAWWKTCFFVIFVLICVLAWLFVVVRDEWKYFNPSGFFQQFFNTTKYPNRQLDSNRVQFSDPMAHKSPLQSNLRHKFDGDGGDDDVHASDDDVVDTLTINNNSPSFTIPSHFPISSWLRNAMEYCIMIMYAFVQLPFMMMHIATYWHKGSRHWWNNYQTEFSSNIWDIQRIFRTISHVSSSFGSMLCNRRRHDDWRGQIEQYIASPMPQNQSNIDELSQYTTLHASDHHQSSSYDQEKQNNASIDSSLDCHALMSGKCDTQKKSDHAMSDHEQNVSPIMNGDIFVLPE